jgi:hypothetical protein
MIAPLAETVKPAERLTDAKAVAEWHRGRRAELEELAKLLYRGQLGVGQAAEEVADMLRHPNRKRSGPWWSGQPRS